MNLFTIVPTSKLDNEKINKSIDAGGRFGNIFFRNMCSSLIANRNNLVFSYENMEEFKKLGIKLYTEGMNIYENTLLVTDSNIDLILFNKEYFSKYLYKNNILFYQHNYKYLHEEGNTNCWAQTESIAKYIKTYLNNNKEEIINHNPNKDLYNNNNNVFIHVRLGDTIDLKFFTSYDYYDKALSELKFDKGYISSDSIDHEICQKLINKYNLEIYNNSEVNTIQFASVNKYLVLSSGTFSWVLGVFGFYSKIFYPKIKFVWHGNIFVFDDWIEIDYN